MLWYFYKSLPIVGQDVGRFVGRVWAVLGTKKPASGAAERAIRPRKFVPCTITACVLSTKLLYQSGRALPPDDRKGVRRLKLSEVRLEIRFLGWRLVLIFK